MSESLQKLRAEGGYSLVTEYVKKGGREGRKEQEARGDEEAGWHLSEALKKVKEEHEDRSPAGSLIYQFRGLRAERESARQGAGWGTCFWKSEEKKRRTRWLQSAEWGSESRRAGR